AAWLGYASLGTRKSIRRRFMRFTRVLMPALAMTAALLASIATVGAQDKGKKKGGFQLPPMIHISIADFTDGRRVPNKYTCAASPTSPSPAMTWSGAPATTQSYVVILHDPDPVLGGCANNDVLQWAIFDIPAESKGLPEGVKAGEQADGSRQINNIAGNPVY